MDFPSSLRPSLFMTGPLGLSDIPDLSFMCSWRDTLTLPESPPQNCKTAAPHSAKALLWQPAMPGPLPLLPPCPDPWDPGVTAQDLLFRGGFRYRRQPQAVLDVTEQLSRFLWDHGDIAFAPLGKMMLENFRLEGGRNRSKKPVVSAKRLLQDLSGHQPWGCPWAYLSHRLRRFSIVGGPVLGKSVSRLLGGLLHEELATRWERLLLDEAFTGGALAWLPGRTPQVGQLVYPAGGALDRLRFQDVILTSDSEPQVLGDPGCIQLQGPVRQVVTSTVQGETLLAVRSDYHCAVWKVGRQRRPAPLQVLQVEKGATGISLSPHLPGELALCSCSGAICLWTPQNGLQQVYKDPETLVFRDPSPWRWADFTAHPRVLTVGDRTGVKMIDTQGPPGCGLLLFRAGAEASCQKGERVLLTQYLGQSGPKSLPPTLHLICTQFSLYLVDERLPLVPMLKWNHDLPSPALLAHLLPLASPGAPQPLFLGGLGGQVRLLHITGKEASAPQLAGPPQSVPSPADSLSAFPLLEPKSQKQLLERLEAPTIASSLHQDAGPPSDPEPDCPVPRTTAPPVDQRPIPSWTTGATACCSRWLEALLQVPSAPPVWAAPTFSHRRLLGRLKHQEVEGKVLQGLRAAMVGGRLLQQKDLGLLPPAELPPAPEPGPQDELSERLEEAWEGLATAWWRKQQGKAPEPGKQARRPKRRTQLSSTFSSLTSCLDLPDTASPPPTLEQIPTEARLVTPYSQESAEQLWVRGVHSERQQTLRDYMAKLPLPKSTPAPEHVAMPSSQASCVQATPSRLPTPGSQPQRKRPRMGF
ncbi:TATA box-binding protein-associated factor RNA polymerase I subunit C isoform X3 [Octodon degus]|uniref:TATA box-binding protein-associated factor RNA polymerase I subunit C isoform X3 n=1 Tax=Octodon degus TaxID=10160 RepID=A0A6P6DR98_OCTDE|nr:TATA box-binding protein-associated factor RNA polymerase I subunit C isoform X3 [Octodon degus]